MNAATQRLDIDVEDFIKLSHEDAHNGLNSFVQSSSNDFLDDSDGLAYSNTVDNLDEYDIYGEKKPVVQEKKKQNKNKAVPDLNSDSLFPSLGSANPKVSSAWASKKHVTPISTPTSKPSARNSEIVSQTLNLKLGQSTQNSNQLRETVQKVQKRFGVNINVSSSKISGITTFIIKGHPDKVPKAEREIKAGVAPKTSATISVPSNITRFILGSKGRNLAQLQQKTMTNITVPPRENEDGDEEDSYIEVSIVGELSGVQEAKREIESIIREKAVKVELKITEIPATHYPFLAGPKGSLLKSYLSDSSVEVKVPFVFENQSNLIQDDHPIVILGAKESLSKTKSTILEAYENLKDDISDLTISIPKSKHCFLIGPNGANLKDFFAASGCIVRIPEASNLSNKVTIIGPSEKLAQSVALLMEKANSAQASTIDVEKLHKSVENYLSSLYTYFSTTSYIQELEKKHKVQVQIPFVNKPTGKIDIIGKVKEDVQKAKASLESHIKALPPTCFASLTIPKELHNYIKGVENAKLEQANSKYNIQVIVPGSNLNTTSITLFSPKSDKKALSEVKAQIEKDISGLLNIDSKAVTVPNKIHRHIIGPNGSTLESIIGKLGESKVLISFGSKPITGFNLPEHILFTTEGLSPNQISISGPSSEIERISKELEKLAVEMEDYEKARSYSTSFTIPTKHSSHIVGRNGSNINKLKQNYDVKIEMDKSSNSETTVKVQGVQQNADKVKHEIISQVEKLADHTEEKIRVPSQYHRSIIGAQGKYVKRLEEKYNVFIKFPASIKSISDNENEEENDKQAPKVQIGKDELLIKGGKRGVSEAKAEIMEIVEFERENNNKVNFKVAKRFLPHILGRNGININLIKDETNTRIDIDKKEESEGESDITILGTKSGIKEAQKRILKIVSEMEQKVTEQVIIPNKFHSNLIGPGGSRIRQLVAKVQGLDSSDPEVNANMVKFPKGKDDDTVTVKGDKEIVAKVIDALKQASSALENINTITVEIDPEHHATLIGRGGAIIKSLMNKYEVDLNFPRRDSKGPEASIITISGNLENCEAVKKDLLSRIPVNESFDFPQKFHHSLLGRGNSTIRKLQISWVLKGSNDNIAKAKKYLEKLYKDIKDKNHVIRLYSHPSTHGLIVGRGGSTINQIRAETKCEIELPSNNNNSRRKGDNSPFSDGTAIIICGSEENTLLAKDQIITIISTQK
ncbi:hypothetical protein K502DRAFT_294937 [Neoconidiobolus thromboides FSU 785]|nr:hypothetical protein K502DRAFT_294937 [Neoconidiobolus thromboides FSU 785]